MSVIDDFVPGMRCGVADGDDQRCGGYQFPALDTDGQVIDLTALDTEFVRITWFPAAATDALFHGFFKTKALADVGFDPTTDSSDDPAVIVPTAPDVLPTGTVDVGVPISHRWLRVEASAGSGRCLVRSADNVKRA